MSDIRLNAIYEQQGHELPLLTAIEALRSIHELTAISAAASGLPAGSMSHHVLAPKRGSFELIVLLHAVLPQALGRLFSMNEAEVRKALEDARGFAGDVLKIARVIQSFTYRDGEMEVKVSGENLARVIGPGGEETVQRRNLDVTARSPRALKLVKPLIEPLLAGDAAALRLEGGHDTARLDAGDAQAFAEADETVEDEAVEGAEVTDGIERTVTLRSAAWDEKKPLKWHVQDQTGRYAVAMADEDFLRDVLEGREIPGPGSELDVILTERRNGTTLEYVVREVVEHRKGAA